MQFKDYIFPEFYTLYDKVTDPNKDSEGKGTQERFCEVWGGVIDETTPHIDNLGANTIVPKTRLDKFVGYAEQELGYLPEWVWFFNQEVALRKNLVALMPELYQIRSTLRAYEVMLAWLGLTITITEDFQYAGGFDSYLTLDSPVRKLDSYSNTVVDYHVVLTGPVGLIPVYGSIGPPYSLSLQGVIEGIYTFLLFNQPVNISLKTITYNGLDISSYISDIAPNYLRINF